MFYDLDIYIADSLCVELLCNLVENEKSSSRYDRYIQVSVLHTNSQKLAAMLFSDVLSTEAFYFEYYFILKTHT